MNFMYFRENRKFTNQLPALMDFCKSSPHSTTHYFNTAIEIFKREVFLIHFQLYAVVYYAIFSMVSHTIYNYQIQNIQYNLARIQKLIDDGDTYGDKCLRKEKIHSSWLICAPCSTLNIDPEAT